MLSHSEMEAIKNKGSKPICFLCIDISSIAKREPEICQRQPHQIDSFDIKKVSEDLDLMEKRFRNIKILF